MAPRELIVVPVSLPWLEALLEGDSIFVEQFNVPVVPGWCVFPETLPFALKLARLGQRDWGVHLFFDSSDGALVGNGGWKGPPVDGRAELGYAVAESRRNLGFATAAVRELTARGRAGGLDCVVAHTLSTESASTSVLRKCGFTRVGEVDDPDDGPVWRWELRFAYQVPPVA
jgi:[ribosomal protein S5]-alanine N-acetyltransferase